MLQKETFHSSFMRVTSNLGREERQKPGAGEHERLNSDLFEMPCNGFQLFIDQNIELQGYLSFEKKST